MLSQMVNSGNKAVHTSELSHFPSVWRWLNVDNARYLYGFSARSDGYTVYVSDMLKVWMAEASKVDIYAQARSLGVAGFDQTQFFAFVDELSLRFRSEKVAIHHHRRTFKVKVQIDSLLWEIQLRPASSDETCGFFRKLSMCGFANHTFLVYRVSQLENLIRARDKYLLYLEENYKTVNGSELMDKYRRQHSADAVFLSPYDKNAVDERIVKQYREIPNRTDTVGVALRDTVTWEANEAERPRLPKREFGVGPELTIKVESGVVPKMEPERVEHVKVESGEGVRGRRRVGSVSPRKTGRAGMRGGVVKTEQDILSQQEGESGETESGEKVTPEGKSKSEKKSEPGRKQDSKNMLISDSKSDLSKPDLSKSIPDLSPRLPRLGSQAHSAQSSQNLRKKTVKTESDTQGSMSTPTPVFSDPSSSPPESQSGISAGKSISSSPAKKRRRIGVSRR